jgi:hypothetical protein
MSNNLVNDTRLADLNKQLAALGKESVNTAKPKLALVAARAAQERVITEDDAKATFDQYLAAQAKAAAANSLAAGGGDSNPDSYKSNLSKHRQCIRVGALPNVDGVDVLNRAIEIRARLVEAGQKVKATYQAIVDAASKQCKQPDNALSDDDLTDIVRKVEKDEADDSLLNDLIGTYKTLAKRLDRAHTDAPNVVPSVEAALNSIGDAIKALDGELPAVTKEEKQAEAFALKAKKLGFALSPAAPADALAAAA